MHTHYKTRGIYIYIYIYIYDTKLQFKQYSTTHLNITLYFNGKKIQGKIAYQVYYVIYKDIFIYE